MAKGSMRPGKEARKPINTIFRTNYDRRVPADLNPLPTNWTEAAAHGIAAGDYQMHFDRMSQAGYRPYWIDGYSVGGKVAGYDDDGERWFVVSKHDAIAIGDDAARRLDW